MSDTLNKQAQELASRPYFIKVTRDETTDDQPIYLAHVLELDGCFGQGETPEAAVKDLRLAVVDFVESLLQDGLSVPAPAELATTSTSISKTFTVSNRAERNTIISNPHRNVYVPAS
ncbi:MAG: type II toxin-antitoxin system HicB family antitoxin [Chloroflexota bacterium]